jgi:hypothetical protein
MKYYKLINSKIDHEKCNYEVIYSATRVKFVYILNSYLFLYTIFLNAI